MVFLKAQVTEVAKIYAASNHYSTFMTSFWCSGLHCLRGWQATGVLGCRTWSLTPAWPRPIQGDLTCFFNRLSSKVLTISTETSLWRSLNKIGIWSLSQQKHAADCRSRWLLPSALFETWVPENPKGVLIVFPTIMAFSSYKWKYNSCSSVIIVDVEDYTCTILYTNCYSGSVFNPKPRTSMFVLAFGFPFVSFGFRYLRCAQQMIQVQFEAR